MHIALGWEYRGRRTRQGTVVYIALEGSNGFNARAEAFRRQHPDVTGAPFFLVPAHINLIADHAALVADIKAQAAAAAR